MGVDTHVYLPQAGVETIATALAFVLGQKKPETVEDTNPYRHPVIEFKMHDNIPELISFQFMLRDEQRYCNYHLYGGRDHRGMCLLSARARPLWIAAFKRLHDVFGGVFEDNDCDDKEERKPVVNWYDAEDGEEYHELKQNLFNIQPITYEDLIEAKNVAAYPDGDDELIQALKLFKTPLDIRNKVATVDIAKVLPEIMDELALEKRIG